MSAADLSSPRPSQGASTGRTGPCERFRYDGFDFDGTELICRYDLDGTLFEEQVRFATTAGALPDDAAVQAAARLVWLLAGVSYYKAGAPPVIEVADGLTAAERTLLEAFYLDGLAEFAYVNDLDLSGVVIDAPVGPHDRQAGDRGGPFDGVEAGVVARRHEQGDVVRCVAHPLHGDDGVDPTAERHQWSEFAGG